MWKSSQNSHSSGWSSYVRRVGRGGNPTFPVEVDKLVWGNGKKTCKSGYKNIHSLNVKVDEVLKRKSMKSLEKG